MDLFNMFIAMKKSSIIALLIAAAAMTAPSCSNLEITADQPENSGETTVFHITATAPNTKTVFGAKDGSSYPTLWTTSKDVRFSANGNALVDATPSKSGAQASFSPAFSSPATSGTIYAFSPKGTYPSVPGFTSLITVNETNDAIYLDIPSAQTPLENSVDESAQAIVAEAEYTTGNTSISMTFNHLLAYGKMQITNFDSTIKSVELQFPENVAGQNCRYLYQSN